MKTLNYRPSGGGRDGTLHHSSAVHVSVHVSVSPEHPLHPPTLALIGGHLEKHSGVT